MPRPLWSATSWACTRPWPKGPQEVERWPAHRDRCALRARMAVGAGGRRLRRVRPRPALLPQRGAGLCAGQEGSPAFIPGAFQIAMAQFRPSRRCGKRCRPARASAGTSTTPPVPRHRALLPPRLHRQPGEQLDPGARRRRGEARGRRARSPTSAAATARRPIIMAQAFPASSFVGFDYHAPSIEHARERAEAAGVADRVRFEVAQRAGLPRRRLRPGRHLRLPARHGRSGRRGAHVRRALQARRHLADRRAVRQRPLEDNLNPVGRIFYSASTLHLHAGLALAGGRRLPRRAGRRGTPARCRDEGRLHPLPPRDADAVQPGARSAALSMAFAAGCLSGAVALILSMLDAGHRVGRGHTARRPLWPARCPLRS